MRGEVTDGGKAERDAKDGMRIQGWKDEWENEINTLALEMDI